MPEMQLFQLEQLSVVEIHGKDAGTIVHNLTTQAIRDLPEGDSTETFVTDVKGKMVGHVMVLRDKDCFRLIGPPGQSQGIAEHIDRYIIREDATVSVHDDEYCGLVFYTSLADEIVKDLPCEKETSIETTVDRKDTSKSSNDHHRRAHRLVVQQISAWMIDVPWLTETTKQLPEGISSNAKLVLTPNTEKESFLNWISSNYSCTVESEIEFHRLRTFAGFPWFGIDLDHSNLPQEADRDAQTISFTKGCYLGQETIARLDAMGQVQKKLVRWRIEGHLPPLGATVTADNKTVGRLTSITELDGGVFAIGPARRTHFDPGSVGTVTHADASEPNEGEPASATVID